MRWWRKWLWPEESATSTLSAGGRTFTVHSETKIVGLASAPGDDVNARTETIVSVSTGLGPCPPLRVMERVVPDPRDENAGAVALGVPGFDDRFLVFCDDFAFVRRLTPALTAAPTESTAGLELGGGRITVHRRGIRHNATAANYLNALIPLLPPELRR